MGKKKKLEQVILAVLIPVFILSFLYVRFIRGRAPGRGYETAKLEAKFKEDETIDMIPKPAGALDVKYKGSSRDPLKDLFQIYLYKLRLEEEKRPRKLEKRIVPLPELNIEGLIWNTEIPQAIINGKVLRIGDTIEGVEVVNIEKKGITVIHQGETVFLPRK